MKRPYLTEEERLCIRLDTLTGALAMLRFRFAQLKRSSNMKYFKPIRSGTNAGMTFKQYIGNNFKVPFLVALFAVVYFLIKFFVTKDFEAIYTLFVFLGLAVVWFMAMVIDWGIKRKRWED